MIGLPTTAAFASYLVVGRCTEIGRASSSSGSLTRRSRGSPSPTSPICSATWRCSGIPAGSAAALRFEVIGLVDGAPAVVLEHVTRLREDLCPHWPQPAQPGGSYRIEITGEPSYALDLCLGSTRGDHNHAGLVATAMRVADEFGYDLVIDHGTEGFLIADLIAERGVPVLIGPLLTSRSKVELRNRSLANPGRLAAAGVEISIITDHPVVPVHFLVHQATLAVKEGLDPEVALRALTINPAKVLGVADRVGSLEVGKLGDVVIWSGDPLDVMQRALQVLIAGVSVYRYE